jgi:hypothetical protein
MDLNKGSKLNEWMWWSKGDCIVRVIKTGHFPTTVMVELPDNRETEVDIVELQVPADK